MKLFHGSYNKLEKELILKNQGNGYNSHKSATENILEKFRPIDKISRLEAVFLSDDISEIDNLGGYTDFVYEVEVISNYEKADLSWVTELSCLVNDGDITDKKAKELSLNYWNGVISGNPCFEYRTLSARVIKEV